MAFPRKTFLRLLIAYILALILLSLAPRYEHIQDFDRAFFVWYKHPTPENEAAFRFQQQRKMVRDWEINAIGAFVLVGAGYGIFGLVRLSTWLLKSK